MMTTLIIFILLILSLFLILIGQFSWTYKLERIRLESLVAKEIITRIENIRTYGHEENGWKNNFPSFLGLERTTLHISQDFILITGKSDFPFVFKSEIQPFLISMQPDQLIKRLGYSRIFKPVNIRTTNYDGDLELTIKPSGFLGTIKVRLSFESIGKVRLEKLFQITNW